VSRSFFFLFCSFNSFFSFLAKTGITRPETTVLYRLYIIGFIAQSVKMENRQKSSVLSFSPYICCLIRSLSGL
jgi:hypothetical protein